MIGNPLYRREIREYPSEKLKELAELVKDVFQLIPPTKHIIGRDLERLKSSPSLKYRIAGRFLTKLNVKV